MQPTGTSDADVAAHTSSTRATVELLLVGLGTLAASMSQALLIPILGKLPEDIASHPSESAVEWLLTSTLLVAAVAVPLFGRLGDMFGKRRLLLVALALLVVGSVLSALTDNMALLITGRAIQGGSMAAIPLGISLLATLLPRERVGSAMAVISAMLGVGGALAMPIGGLIGQHADYHWIFWLTAVIGAVAVIGIFFVVPEAHNRTPGKVDLPGTVLLSGALVALLLPLAETADWGWGARTIGLLVAALVLFVLFGLVETRSREPLVDLKALRRRPIVLTNTASILLGFSMFAMMIGVANYVQAPTQSGYGFGSSIVVSGLAMLPSGLMMLLLSPISARGIRRFGAPRMMAAGALVVAVGWLLRIVLTDALWEIIVSTSLSGVGVALAYAAMPTLINTHTPAHEIAAANGLNSLARSIGSSIASAIGGSILAGSAIVATVDGRVTGWSSLGSYRVLFAMSAAAGVISALIAFMVPRHADPDALPEA